MGPQCSNAWHATCSCANGLSAVKRPVSPAYLASYMSSVPSLSSASFFELMWRIRSTCGLCPRVSAARARRAYNGDNADPKEQKRNLGVWLTMARGPFDDSLRSTK